jgi:hypothetical protein
MFDNRWFSFIHNRFQMKNHNFDVWKYLHFYLEGFPMVSSLKGFIMMPYFIHETCSKPRLQVTIKVRQGMNPTTNIKPKIHTLPNLDKFSSHVLAWTTLIIIHIAHKIFMLGAKSYKCLFIWFELTCVWERTFLQVNNSIWILCAKWK